MELDEWETRDQVLKTQNTQILETLASGGILEWYASLSVPQIETVRAKIEPLLRTQLERPETLRGFKKIRDRSPSEYDRLLEWIDACLNKVPQEFRELNDALKEDTNGAARG